MHLWEYFIPSWDGNADDVRITSTFYLKNFFQKLKFETIYILLAGNLLSCYFGMKIIKKQSGFFSELNASFNYINRLRNK